EETLDARKAAFRFDRGLLTGRLAGATEWLFGQPTTRGLRIGYFGSGNVAIATLVAAARRPSALSALVCLDGLPELAEGALAGAAVPTLLVVRGDTDEPHLALNRAALTRLGTSEKQLVEVVCATPLDGEPGAWEEIARLAVDWF